VNHGRPAGVPAVSNTLLQWSQHYWVTSQSEYSIDIIFKSSSDLRELFPRLISHSTLCFGAKEVMSFVGRILTGHFGGEIVTGMRMPASGADGYDQQLRRRFLSAGHDAALMTYQERPVDTAAPREGG
jgi:hypothetical protein